MGQRWLAKGLISLLRLAQLYIPGETKAVVDFVSSSLTRPPAVSGSFGCFVSGCGGETKIKVWLLVKIRFENRRCAFFRALHKAGVDTTKQWNIFRMH